jgi:4-hydroxybenzoate polyprenyltransferase
MGHLIFIILHLIAFIFIGYVFLFITIPLHLIYAILQGKSDRSLKRKCPYCAEMVKVEAIVCKHCGKDLEKFEGKKEEHIVTPAPSIKHGKVLLILIIIFAIITAYFITNKTNERPPRPSTNTTQDK